MLHRGALGQGEVVDQCGRAAGERTRRGGGAAAAAPAPAVVGTFYLHAAFFFGDRGRRTHVLVGHVEQACVLAAPRRHGHSHSMVPGGFDVTSSATRFTPSTSLMMREAIRSTRS